MKQQLSKIAKRYYQHLRHRNHYDSISGDQPIEFDFLCFKNFYEDVYVEEFPDDNKREPFENFEEYLRLEAEGWYGRNSYQILVGVEDRAAYFTHQDL